MNKKILILEDEIEIAEAYAKQLTRHGYESVIASNGLEGLELLKDIKPDLILLDLGMPKMDGIEFYQRICGRDDRPIYPVMVVTGRTDLMELFKDLHVEGFLIKPFAERHLIAKIAAILHKQHWRKEDGSARKVVIVDDNQPSSEEIKHVLNKAGYICETASSGLAGIEKITDNPPDLAVISLGLEDLSGDLVILKLQGMRKTKYIKYILYIRKNYKHDKTVLEHFAHKTGVKLMCEYSKPSEILEATAGLFQDVEQHV